jgi:hypothetical protein
LSALALPAAAPLSLLPSPFRDELLLSWLNQIGRANDMRLDYLLTYIGVNISRIWRNDVSPGLDVCAAIANATRRNPDEINAMIMAAAPSLASGLVSPKRDFQFCPKCVSSFTGPVGITARPIELPRFRLPITLRHWRYAWTVRCHVCDSALVPLCCNPMSPDTSFMQGKRHEKHALEGASLLSTSVSECNRRLLRRCKLALNFACCLYERGDFQSLSMTSNLEMQIAGLSAIARAQKQPIRKLGWLLTTSNRRRYERIMFVVCHRNSGPMNLLVSALKEELRHGEKSQTGRDHCEAA